MADEPGGLALLRAAGPVVQLSGPVDRDDDQIGEGARQAELASEGARGWSSSAVAGGDGVEGDEAEGHALDGDEDRRTGEGERSSPAAASVRRWRLTPGAPRSRARSSARPWRRSGWRAAGDGRKGRRQQGRDRGGRCASGGRAGRAWWSPTAPSRVAEAHQSAGAGDGGESRPGRGAAAVNSNRDWRASRMSLVKTSLRRTVVAQAAALARRPGERQQGRGDHKGEGAGHWQRSGTR